MIIDRAIAYVCGAVAVAALAAATLSFWQLRSTRVALEAKTLENAELRSSVDTQNRAVEALGESTKKARQNAAQALAAAKVVSAQHRGVIDALQARILASRELSCAPAISEIRELLK